MKPADVIARSPASSVADPDPIFYPDLQVFLSIRICLYSKGDVDSNLSEGSYSDPNGHPDTDPYFCRFGTMKKFVFELIEVILYT